jgi:hypothetical protein
MIRGWILRGLAVTLLAVCVAAWVGSYWRTVEFYHANPAGDYVQTLCVSVGRVDVNQRVLEGPVAPEWRYWSEANNPKAGFWLAVYARDRYEKARWRWWGFSLEPAVTGWVMVPLWFLAVCSAGVVIWVWRKTRAKYNGKGFPVEVGGCAGEERG